MLRNVIQCIQSLEEITLKQFNLASPYRGNRTMYFFPQISFTAR